MEYLLQNYALFFYLNLIPSTEVYLIKQCLKKSEDSALSMAHLFTIMLFILVIDILYMQD